MSEREEQNSNKNKASIEAVKKLPRVEIEEKHCKATDQARTPGKTQTKMQKKPKRQQLEPPTCTVCVELI